MPKDSPASSKKVDQLGESSKPLVTIFMIIWKDYPKLSINRKCLLLENACIEWKIMSRENWRKWYNTYEPTKIIQHWIWIHQNNQNTFNKIQTTCNSEYENYNNNIHTDGNKINEAFKIFKLTIRCNTPNNKKKGLKPCKNLQPW